MAINLAMKTYLLAFTALLSFAAPSLADDSPPHVSTDYALAYKSAVQTKRLLAVAIGMPEGWYWTKEYPGHSLCRVPANHTYWPKRGVGLSLLSPAGEKRIDLGRMYCVLIDQPGFKEVLDNPHEFDVQPRFDEPIKGGGIVILDPEQGTVVSVLPRRYCTPSGIDALMRLPRGTLTQRSLIWAIRMRPERPRSTDGTPSARLFAHADENNRRQAERQTQGHHTPIGYLGNAAEIAAESWPWHTHVVDAAVDCVDAWRHSHGHWSAAMKACREYGYDMRRGRSNWFGGQEVWFATGVMVQ